MEYFLVLQIIFTSYFWLYSFKKLVYFLIIYINYIISVKYI